MSNRENEVLDSLLDSLSDDQEMKQKINEFARNKERQRRIQRARATSEQFQQTYSRSSQQESSLDNIVEKTREQPVFHPRNIPIDEPEETDKTYESLDIPDFMRSHNVSDLTINLNELDRDGLEYEPRQDEQRQVNENTIEQTRQFVQNDRVSPSRSVQSQPNRHMPQQSYEAVDHMRMMPTPDRSRMQPRQDIGGATRQMVRHENLQEAAYRSHPADSTRVFDHRAPMKSNQAGGTVRMNQDEIRNLLDKEEPILKREYLQDEDGYSDRYDRKSRRKKSGAKGALIFGAVLLGIVALFGGGYALKSFIDTTIADKQGMDEGFDALMDWIAGYNSYSDEEKMDILDFRKTYEKLSQDAKDKVNSLISSVTGKSFDELLAIATMGDKPESSVENVANAEKKAKLREQVETLELEVSELSKQLSEIDSRAQSAERKFNDKQSVYNAYQSDVKAASDAIASYQSQLNNLPSISDLQSQLIILQSQLERLEANEGNEESVISMQQRVASLQNQIDTHDSTVADLESKISMEQNNLQQASSKANTAKTEMDSANSEWQAIKDEKTPIQEKIDSKNSKIQELKDEMDAIQ